MSVADASLVADALAGTAAGIGGAAAAALGRETAWSAPHLMPAEVLSAIRGLALGGHISEVVAADAAARVRDLRITLFPLRPLHERVWELRRNATPYDAWYLALAEILGTPLVTTDEKMAAIPGVRCEVLVVRAQ